jgi:hypothetical protein
LAETDPHGIEFLGDAEVDQKLDELAAARSPELSDMDKLDEIVTALEAGIAMRQNIFDSRGVDKFEAKLELYKALRDLAATISTSIGSREIAQAVIRDNYPVIAPALRLAEMEGLI